MFPIKDNLSELTIMKNLIVIPSNETQLVLKFYHHLTYHKNYHVLYEKIINEAYYWKGIIQDCKTFINNCLICKMKNKTIFYLHLATK